MNHFYYFEGNVYETLADVEFAAKDYNTKNYDTIETSLDWSEFNEEFYYHQHTGADDAGALDMACTGGLYNFQLATEKVEQYTTINAVTERLKNLLEIDIAGIQSCMPEIRKLKKLYQAYSELNVLDYGTTEIALQRYNEAKEALLERFEQAFNEADIDGLTIFAEGALNPLDDYRLREEYSNDDEYIDLTQLNGVYSTLKAITPEIEADCQYFLDHIANYIPTC